MTVKLKLELKWSKIKRVVTLPGDLNLVDLHDVLQAMFGFYKLDDENYVMDFSRP